MQLYVCDNILDLSEFHHSFSLIRQVEKLLPIKGRLSTSKSNVTATKTNVTQVDAIQGLNSSSNATKVMEQDVPPELDPLRPYFCVQIRHGDIGEEHACVYLPLFAQIPLSVLLYTRRVHLCSLSRLVLRAEIIPF
jgi:hypothetical protein